MGKLFTAGCALLLAGTLCTASAAASKKHAGKPASKAKSPLKASAKSSSAKSASSHGKKSRKVRSKRVRGQKAIDSQRTQEIQQALIREHLLTGAPTGKWDDATQDALRRYQAQNGWQSKTVPDSRALIKLGLGPNHDHLLNPETAMTMSPESFTSTPASEKVTPAGLSARPQR